MTAPDAPPPQSVLSDTAWRFDGERFDDHATFSQEVRQAQIEVAESDSWRPGAIAIPRGRVRVTYAGTDPDLPYDYVPRVIELVSDDGGSFSAEELLFKLHNAVVEELRDADHRYFEGLRLKGVGADGVPEYELVQGS